MSCGVKFFFASCDAIFSHKITSIGGLNKKAAAKSIDGDFLRIYLKDGARVSPVANVFGPGFDIEKYIFAALVVPKSRFEPVSCTLLKASRNI